MSTDLKWMTIGLIILALSLGVILNALYIRDISRLQQIQTKHIKTLMNEQIQLEQNLSQLKRDSR